MSNALIAGPTEVSTPFTGTFLLEDGEALAQAIRDGDWLAGGMAAFSGVVDTVAAISNPLGTAISMGVGWVLEHVDPLKGWMNDLTGDAGEVGGFAMTWNNVAHQLNMSAEELQRKISDLSDMSGASVDAYRQFQREAAAHIGAAGSWAQAMGTGLEICSTIVKIVHDITRDAIAEVVGAVISYAAELVFTVGLATPLVIEQIATKVASLSARVGKAITKLVDAARALQKLLKQLGELLKKAGDLLGSALRRGDAPRRSPNSPEVDPRRQPTPDAGGSTPPHTNLPEPPRNSNSDGVDFPDLSDIDKKYRDDLGEIPEDRLPDWANEVSEAYPTLSPSEVLDAHYYTTGAYVDINDYLRGRSTPTDVLYTESRINGISDAISRLPPVEGTTWRGASTTPDFRNQFVAGETWSDPGFLSSSTDATTANGFSGKMNPTEEPAIFTVEGRTGVSLTPISQYAHETEVLFQRGTVFDVISKEKVGNVWQIVLREVPSG